MEFPWLLIQQSKNNQKRFFESTVQKNVTAGGKNQPNKKTPFIYYGDYALIYATVVFSS